MDVLDIVILAIIQGLTEFLPVSSSGHLVVGGAMLEALGRSAPVDLLEVNIVLHLGTLIAVVAFYWREVARLLREDRRLIPLLILGTIPVAAIGIPLKEFGSDALESPLLAGLMFPVTAAILLWASRAPEGTGDYRQLSWKAALGIGMLQALALLPGISRSGATITGGLAAGLDRQSAGTFAFLLAIPAIGGAGTYQVLKLIRESATTKISEATPVPTLILGGLVAMVVGWFALWWLVRWIRAGRLAAFAWYLIPLGMIVTVWQVAQQ